MFLSHIRREICSPGLIRMASAAATSRKSLEGKVALVTASTEGIGFAIAKRLGEEGAHVVISSRKQANVDKALKQLQDLNLSVSGTTCHVSKAEDRLKLIEQASQQHGGIDILVSNAAANPAFGPIMDTTTETVWDKIFDTNVKSAFFLCKEALPHMEKKGGGSIIFVSSIGGYVPFEYIAPYSVSKTALLGLVKAMAPQCAEKNIRVNAIAPGIIKTGFSKAMWQNEEVEKTVISQIPMKRLGLPDECAGTVAFLASDSASYITGETIVMSGGMSSRL